jgi:hypothetical protein
LKSAPVEAPALATAQPTLFEKFDLEQAAKLVAEKKAADPEAPPAPVEPPKDGDPAKVEEPPKEAPPVEAAKDGEPAKVDEPAKDVEADPAKEAAPVEPPKVELAPIKFEFTLPEEFKLPDEQRGQVESILSEFYAATPRRPTSKSSSTSTSSACQEVRQDMERNQHDVFGRVRDGWAKEVKADPEIGGNNHDGAMQAIAYVRDNFVSTAERGSAEYESGAHSVRRVHALHRRRR